MDNRAYLGDLAKSAFLAFRNIPIVTGHWGGYVCRIVYHVMCGGGVLWVGVG